MIFISGHWYPKYSLIAAVHTEFRIFYRPFTISESIITMLSKQVVRVMIGTDNTHQEESVGGDIIEELPSDKVTSVESAQTELENKLRLPPARMKCRSPVTVQEWVAALPDLQEGEEVRVKDDSIGVVENHLDNLSLGAEGEIELRRRKN